MSVAPPPSLDRSYQAVRRSSGLSLLQCQCRAGPGDRGTDEQHSAFSVTLVERGSFRYRTRRGGAVLGPGWLMLGNEGDGYVCSHEAGNGSGDDCLSLSLPAPLMDGIVAALGEARTRIPFEQPCLPPSPRVAALLQSCRKQAAEGFALEEAAIAVVASVRASIGDGEAPAPLARQDERAHAAAQHMDAHGAEPITLDDLARAAGLSPFHLLRVFREAIGITPHQYLMRTRLLRAVTLLRDTQLPVTEVAYASGWADLSNFNRAFRRELRCAPRELRRGDRKLMRWDGPTERRRPPVC